MFLKNVTRKEREQGYRESLLILADNKKALPIKSEELTIFNLLK